VSGTLFTTELTPEIRRKEGNNLKTKKSGLKVVTLIATLNPVSQVLW
jgi:hypothetical protein